MKSNFVIKISFQRRVVVLSFLIQLLSLKNLEEAIIMIKTNFQKKGCSFSIFDTNIAHNIPYNFYTGQEPHCTHEFI